MNLYNAEISNGAGMLVETKQIARLLLTNLTQAQCNLALVGEIIL